MTDTDSLFSRRTLLKAAASGFGYLAFAGLSTCGGASGRRPRPGRSPRSRRTSRPGPSASSSSAWTAGPSHVDTFDYKPKLDRRRRQAVSASGRLAGGQAARLALEVHPARPERALDLASCSPTSPGTPTTSASSTACRPTCRPTRRRSCSCTPGSFQFRRPSLGAWTLYGLGTENENLPGFVTLSPPANHGGPANYGSRVPAGRLPGDADRLQRPAGRRRHGRQRHQPPAQPGRPAARSSTSSSRSTASRWSASGVNPDVEGVIESYELAFRMQGALPKRDGPVGRESAATQSAVRHRRRRRPTTSAASACWPAGSSRPACASSRSATAAGTSTAT